MAILDTESHILRLGTVAFATNPFELFLDFGNQIKARSYAEQTFLVQLAGGSEGYLPTEKAEKGGHYSAFIASGLVGHVGGEQLVRETLKNIIPLSRELPPLRPRDLRQPFAFPAVFRSVCAVFGRHIDVRYLEFVENPRIIAGF